MNSGVLMMIAQYMISEEGFSMNSTFKTSAIEKANGISESFFWISMFSAFITPLAAYFSLYHVYRLYMRRKIAKLNEKCLMTQKEANYWYEGSNVEMF